MSKPKNIWQMGFNSETQKYVPVPIFGNQPYETVKAECDRLNEIWRVAAEKAKQRREKSDD